MSESARRTLFTGDDYQLVAEAAYREEERRELFRELHGIEAPADDQLERLADLLRRLRLYLDDAEQYGR